MEVDNRFIKVPLEELTNPQCNHRAEVIADSWWVCKDGHVLGFKLYGPNSRERPTPQCNRDQRVVEKVILSMYEGYKAIYVPVAYWPAHRD